MPAKRNDEPKMVSFRLSAEAQKLLGDTAAAISATAPMHHSKTDVLEMAIRDWCKKKLKNLGRLS